MAKKVDIDLVKMILQRNNVDIKVVNDIVREINEQVDIQDSEEKLPQQKKQFVILVSDPKGVLENKDLVGWVCQVPEEDSPYVAPERICRAAYDFNITPKGRRLPLETISEACEVLPTRILKEHNVWVKNKEPVLVVTTNNIIPKEKTLGKKDNRSNNDDE